MRSAKVPYAELRSEGRAQGSRRFRGPRSGRALLVTFGAPKVTRVRCGTPPSASSSLQQQKRRGPRGPLLPSSQDDSRVFFIYFVAAAGAAEASAFLYSKVLEVSTLPEASSTSTFQVPSLEGSRVLLVL